MVPAIVASRFGPWLTGVVRSKPGFLASLLTKLRAAGVVVGDKVDDVVRYFKSSPASASLTLATIASLGMSIFDLFDGVDVSDNPELSGLVTGLEDVANFATPGQRSAAATKLLSFGSASESFKPGLQEKEVDLIALQETLQWAKQHFGSAQAALRAHRLMQAFVELPYEEARTGYALLKV